MRERFKRFCSFAKVSRAVNAPTTPNRQHGQPDASRAVPGVGTAPVPSQAACVCDAESLRVTNRMRDLVLASRASEGSTAEPRRRSAFAVGCRGRLPATDVLHGRGESTTAGGIYARPRGCRGQGQGHHRRDGLRLSMVAEDWWLVRSTVVSQRRWCPQCRYRSVSRVPCLELIRGFVSYCCPVGKRARRSLWSATSEGLSVWLETCRWSTILIPESPPL